MLAQFLARSALVLTTSLLTFTSALGQTSDCSVPNAYFVLSSGHTQASCLMDWTIHADQGTEGWDLSWNPAPYLWQPNSPITNRSQIIASAVGSTNGLNLTLDLESGGDSTFQLPLGNGVGKRVTVDVYGRGEVGSEWSLSVHPDGFLSLFRSGGTRGTMSSSVSITVAAVTDPPSQPVVVAPPPNTTPNSAVSWPTAAINLSGQITPGPRITKSFGTYNISLRHIATITLEAETSVMYPALCASCGFPPSCGPQSNSARSSGTVGIMTTVEPIPRLHSFAFGIRDSWRFTNSDGSPVVDENGHPSAKSALGGHISARRVSDSLSPWIPADRRRLLTPGVHDTGNSQAMRNAIVALNQQVEPGDTVIIYWSTHGSYDVSPGDRPRVCNGQNCVISAGTQPATSSRTEIVHMQHRTDNTSEEGWNPTDTEVAGWFQEGDWPCVNKVFIIDQCFAEGIAEDLRASDPLRSTTISAVDAMHTTSMVCVPTPEEPVPPDCDDSDGTVAQGFWLPVFGVALNEALRELAESGQPRLNLTKLFQILRAKGYLYNGRRGAIQAIVPDFLGSPTTVSFQPVMVVAPGYRGFIFERCPCDVAGLGGSPFGDGDITIDDIVYYLDRFFATDLAVADIASLGGMPTPDGSLTADDLIAFLSSFFSGCQ